MYQGLIFHTRWLEPDDAIEEDSTSAAVLSSGNENAIVYLGLDETTEPYYGSYAEFSQN